jgi:hypothetical protein
MSVASFDGSGRYRWAYADESPSTATETAMAFPQGVAASGSSVVLAGTFGTCALNCNDGTSPSDTTLVLGGKTLTAVSAGDLFLASFAP